MSPRPTDGPLPMLAAAVFLGVTLWVAWADHVPLTVTPIAFGAVGGLSVVSAFRRVVRFAEETTGSLERQRPRAYVERMVGLNVLALVVYRLLPTAALRGGLPVLVGGAGAYLTLAAVETLGRRVTPA